MRRGALGGVRVIHETERSVALLAATAEDKALLGPEYYAGQPLYPLATTVAVINMDGMNPFAPACDYGIYGAARLGLLDDLRQVAGGWKLRHTPDPKPQAGSFFRSDPFCFAKRGVPAISYSAGQGWEVGGAAAGKAGEDDYAAHRYHQQADEWQPDWILAGTARDLPVLFLQRAPCRRRYRATSRRPGAPVPPCAAHRPAAMPSRWTAS